MRQSIRSLRFTPRAVSSTPLERPASSRDRAIAEEEGPNIAPTFGCRAGMCRERVAEVEGSSVRAEAWLYGEFSSSGVVIDVRRRGEAARAFPVAEFGSCESIGKWRSEGRKRGGTALTGLEVGLKRIWRLHSP